MNISYKKLWIELINRDIKKSELRKLTGLLAGTITKLNKNEPVSIAVLLSICEVLNCDIGDICSAVFDSSVTDDQAWCFTKKDSNSKIVLKMLLEKILFKRFIPAWCMEVL